MDAKPKVLVLTPDFPPQHGGIQVLAHRIVSHWTRVTPTVVTLGGNDGTHAFDAGQSFSIVRVATSAKLRQLDIGSLNYGGLRAALRLRPDAVLSLHIVTSPAAAAIKTLLRVPYVQYFYAKEIGAKPGLARFAARGAAASTVISQYTGELLAGLGADERRFRLIPPGVDLGPPPQREPAERPTILTISRLEDRYKGHDVVMRAMPLIRARVPDVQWVVIGDGPLRPSLERQAVAEGVSRQVRFLGAVPDEVRDAWLSRAHVFTMPSRLPAGGFAGEGFGIVYLEANARGIPAVAGDVGGARDAVLDGETGHLVDPTDHLAIANVITGLLQDPERAARLGEIGRARAKDFDWPGISRRVEDLLVEVARR